MGKRKKKHRNLTPHQVPHQQNSQPSVVAPQAVHKPVEVRETAVYQVHQAEYNAISSDLIRVAVINGFFLAAVLALYFIDQRNPFLKELFAKIM